MNKKIIAAIAGAGLSAMAVAADEINYTYVEAGYVAIDFDDLDVDGDGFGIAGSLGITDRVYLMADYNTYDLDFGIDATDYGLGVGASLPLSQQFHLIGEIGYTEVEVEVDGFDADDNGYTLGGGFRWKATPTFELSAKLNYVDLDDSGDDTSLSAGALYNFTEAFALGAGIDLADDTTGYSVGFRYDFAGL